jgi:hypothetical protein
MSERAYEQEKNKAAAAMKAQQVSGCRRILSSLLAYSS